MSENDPDEHGEDRDDLDLDRDADQEEDENGEGDNDDENEDNEDDDDEQDQEENQYSYEYSQGQSQGKTMPTLHNSTLNGRSESIQASSGSGPRLSSAPTSHPNTAVVLTSPSPSQAPVMATTTIFDAPKVRSEMLTAPVYDIVPTIAAPHSTSINSICAMPDLRWVFSGGADGYIRKFDWHATVNGKAMLTVAQRHPFVDSVTKAGVLLSYWENEDSQSERRTTSSPIRLLI